MGFSVVKGFTDCSFGVAEKVNELKFLLLEVVNGEEACSCGLKGGDGGTQQIRMTCY